MIAIAVAVTLLMPGDCCFLIHFLVIFYVAVAIAIAIAVAVAVAVAITTAVAVAVLSSLSCCNLQTIMFGKLSL